LGGNVHTKKKNSEALIVATKETGLEVYADKTKYSRNPHIWIGLALQVNPSTILQNQPALKLPVIRLSTVQCYDFCNFKSGVVKMLRHRYILYIVTAKPQTVNVAYFQRKVQLSGFSAYPK